MEDIAGREIPDMEDIAGSVGGDTEWFVHDRLGLFIHWGTYALAARHEWVKQRERLHDAAYDLP